MKKITLLILLGFNILLAQEQPNIVFILTDDQSYGMMGVLETKLFKPLALINWQMKEFYSLMRIFPVPFVPQVEFQYCLVSMNVNMG